MLSLLSLHVSNAPTSSILHEFFTLTARNHPVCTAWLSDHFRVRGIIMLCSLPIAITGYAVIANTHIASVKYGMTFLMATGLYSSVPPVLGWLSNVSVMPNPDHEIDLPKYLHAADNIMQCRTQLATTSERRRAPSSSPSPTPADSWPYSSTPRPRDRSTTGVTPSSSVF